jgi:hypothetical protein
MRTLEQGGVTPLSDATRLRSLLDAGTLTPDRLSDKGKALLLNDDIQTGKRTLDGLTIKGLNLLSKYGYIPPKMAGRPLPTGTEPEWTKQLAQRMVESPFFALAIKGAEATGLVPKVQPVTTKAPETTGEKVAAGAGRLLGNVVSYGVARGVAAPVVSALAPTIAAKVGTLAPVVRPALETGLAYGTMAAAGGVAAGKPAAQVVKESLIAGGAGAAGGALGGVVGGVAKGALGRIGAPAVVGRVVGAGAQTGTLLGTYETAESLIKGDPLEVVFRKGLEGVAVGFILGGATQIGTEAAQALSNAVQGGRNLAYYRQVLGVGPTASKGDVNKAFRVLAKQYHPDVNLSDPTLPAKYAAINEAKHVLDNAPLLSSWLSRVLPPAERVTLLTQQNIGMRGLPAKAGEGGAAVAPVAKAALPSPEIAPTALPQTQAPPPIAAPSASQRVTATTQGKFAGAGPTVKEPWQMTQEAFLQRVASPVYPQSTKSDYVVLYTVTTPEAAEKIATEGLKTSMATGRMGPRNVLFATGKPTEYSAEGTLVAFQYPKYFADDAGPSWAKQILQDVPPNDILAIYPMSFGGGGPARLDTILADARESGYAEAIHKYAIGHAIEQGKPVPASVLADYPDLAAKAQPAATTQGKFAKGDEVEIRIKDKWQRGQIREVDAKPYPDSGVVYPYRVVSGDTEIFVNADRVRPISGTPGGRFPGAGKVALGESTVEAMRPQVAAKETVEYSPAVTQALKEWATNRAYVDGNGNYHVKGEGKRSGPIAPWNKEVKRAFATTDEFHNAAQAFKAPATIQEITTELRAKKEAQESIPETEWTGRTPDVLKQTVQRIEAEQGALPKAVKAKYGEEGFVGEKQVAGVANLFAEMRAKKEVRVSDAEVEKVLSATKSAQTVKAQIVNWFRNAGAAFKDVFSYEWRLADYPRFQDQIRRFQGAQRDAQVSALETYLAIVSPMEDPTMATLGPKRFKLFSRLIDLRDMLEDVRAGKKIAGALTEQQLVEAEAELMAKADQTVKQSLANHDAIMKAAFLELQRRGKVATERVVEPTAEEAEAAEKAGKKPKGKREKITPREHYYPHKVLDYMREIDAKYPGLGAKLKAPYRYYLKKRGGTTRLFDTDYLTVTMNHLTKLYLDNATDDFALEVARDYDAWPRTSEAYRQAHGGTPEAGRIYDDIDEDGTRYFGWSYDAFHRTKNPILTEITDPMLVQADLEARKQMQKFLSQVHVIPEEIANRIAQLKAPAVKAHTLNAIRAMQWFWKNIVLGPFGAGLPFQIANFAGDTVNLLREDPAAVLFIPQGWRAAKEWQKGNVSEKFLHLMDVAEQTRVVEAGMMRAGGLPYDPTLRTLEPMRYALKSLNPFEGYRKLSERRELSGRLAKLMKDLERIGKGEMVVAKLFDVKKLESAGMSPVEVAGKIAREYTVDYGKLTPEGKAVVRDVALPFSTFYVQNFQNWVTYVQRNPGEATLKFLVPLAALAAFNALRFPEEEDKLPPYYRVMPHLITGYKTPDGKPIIVAFQTPVDQAAKMLGLEVVGDLARQVLSGKKKLDDAAKELAGNMALAIPRQMWNLANVFFKAPIEAAMNKNTFTGAPIVSEDIKDTPEGTRQRLNYMLQQWFSPYGQYVRAARDIEPEKALGKWLTEGPADIKRAFGIREVDLEREQISRFYDELDRLEGAYAVWKDKRDAGKQPGAFADMAKLKRLQAVARDFTDQWKVVSRIKADKTRTQEQKDKEVRERYKSMARRTQTVLNPGK